MNHLSLVRELALAMRDAGGQLYVVGGWVRDQLLNVPSKDIDVEVFGIAQDRLPALLARFGHVESVGAQFPVYKLFPEGGGDIDVALPRRESKSGTGHKGFAVEGDPTMTLADAVIRRDFTINAIAWEPLDGRPVDLVGGIDDLKERRLRVVSPATFADDSLRVLRAVQFAARFHLTMDDQTMDICRGISLKDLPAERIWGEIEKLLKARKPSIGLWYMRALGVLDQLFPELKALIDCPQDPIWHPEGDVWTHTLMVVNEARNANDDLMVSNYPKWVTVMLAALVHDVGKPATTCFSPETKRWTSHDHEAQGVGPALNVLTTLNVQTLDGYNVRAQVLALVEHHLKPMMFHHDKAGSGAFRRLARLVDMDLLARMAHADMTGRGHEGQGTGDRDVPALIRWFREKSLDFGVKDKPVDPILMGRHLIDMGLKPGPLFGPTLDLVYEAQMDGSVTTLDDAKRLAAKWIADAYGVALKQIDAVSAVVENKP
jgi:tRNA nucleotidyltransferase (CCA-adding enzyme)